MDEALASHAYRYSLACLSQLVASGVKTIVASPGFRNSPLILAAHRTPGIQVVSAVDERGAGFLALGIARGQRLPVALLCTSGTAVGNYLPAVMEANHAQVPLIVLTGDRPQELVDSGANQCTDQTKIFGSQVRAFFDTAPPSGAPHEEKHAGYLMAKAVSRALHPFRGPVHINLRFREPFLPSPENCARLEGETKPRPWSFYASASGPSDDQAFAINSMLRAARRPLFVLGPGPYGQKLLGRLSDLSARSGIPVAAEAASGFAYSDAASRPRPMHRPERLFQRFFDGRAPSPDLVIRIGAPPTGRNFSKFLAASQVPQLIFEEWGEAREPGFHPSILIEGDPEAWIGDDRVWSEACADSSWSEAMQAMEAQEEARLDAHVAATESFTEWHFHRHLPSLLGSGAALLLGNSMPVRDFNAVFPREGSKLRIFTNRGLSGIDGLIATSVGIALGSSRETHAILGDLSTLHDIPSLSIVSSLRDKINFTLWVMNNGGGEIFRIVQTARSGAPAEWFTTPQTFDLAALAKSFQISYLRVHSSKELSAINSDTFTSSGVRLIEVMVSAEENLRVRKSFQDA